MRPCHFTVLSNEQVFTINAEYLVSGINTDIWYGWHIALSHLYQLLLVTQTFGCYVLVLKFTHFQLPARSKQFFLTSFGTFPSPAQRAVAAFGREGVSEDWPGEDTRIRGSFLC